MKILNLNKFNVDNLEINSTIIIFLIFAKKSKTNEKIGQWII